MLDRLLAADNGYRGPGRTPEPAQAEFVSYRDKTTDTALAVTVSRAWYHCGQCGPAWRPGTRAGHGRQTMLPGCARWRPGREAVPFARGAGLVADLAGSS